ncbi:MAG: helix-turn-helix domain-containing protein [Gallionellaceae bacterium]|nr:helix-turn-helix domain-containing protein [Gallionellaceae bacterium]
MNNELSDCQQAIKLRLAGRSVEEICGILGRSPAWFHIWWRRYRALGPNGLFDLTRTTTQPRRITPDLERSILNIRRRLISQTHPGTRYSLIGAGSILAELQVLHIRPLPSPRTIERILERNGITAPRVRLAPYLSRTTYPKPQANASNQLHEVDGVGPIYLKGNRQRYYIFVCKDVYGGSVCLRIYRSRKMDVILGFLGECWKSLGLPAQVQFDNAREVVGWGPAAKYLSRVLRLCLRFGLEPLLIPPARPQYNGSVENFNGWFQPRLFQRHFTRISALKRELQRLQDTVNTQHVQRRVGGLTPEQYRRRKKLQKLPPRFVVSTDALPIAAGRVTFIRQVTIHGNIHLLSQTFRVGKRLKGQYVKVILDTQRAQLTVYVKGRIFKRWTYPFLKH